MIATSLKFRRYKCFRDEWSGFERFSPITLIVGRNNSGKSQLLELIRLATADILLSIGREFCCTGTLDEQTLKQQFTSNTSGGNLGGNHWTDHGAHLVGRTGSWQTSGEIISNLQFELDEIAGRQMNERQIAERKSRVAAALKSCRTPLSGKRFLHVLADRDVRPEQMGAPAAFAVAADGTGVTATISGFAHNSALDREVVSKTLLNAVNEVFEPDASFSEIVPRIHTDGGQGHKSGDWEIYLVERLKGAISLRDSGSSLKTVLIVLTNLLVLPLLERRPNADYVFAFEELENNLHPSLLRRLLRYVARHVREHGCFVFLTTHSGVCVDFFRGDSDAQLIHVTHDGTQAKTTEVKSFYESLDVLTDLGSKPSDLLQANGVVWCEGPSDRIYINHWISLASHGRLREGRDYQCAYYAGALLASNTFDSPDNVGSAFANLLAINPNVALICDSDRKTPTDPLKPRVERIVGALSSLRPNRTMTWVLEGREIENYLPASCIRKIENNPELPEPGQYKAFAPRESEDSYVTKILGRKSFDKVDFAARAVREISLEEMNLRFDWADRIQQLMKLIDEWSYLRES